MEAYEYEQQERALKEGKNVVTSRHGEGSEQDNGNALQTGAATGNDSGRMAGDATPAVEGVGDRGDIRVYEEGLGASRDEHSEYSERDRREAESERLVGIARENGQYLDRNEVLSRGRRHGKGTGESEVSIDQEKGIVYKIKNPYAKSPMKGGVAPEDAIYEHLVHNKYFPETRYTFEGISDEIGDVRIVLSQDYVDSYGQPTQEQIEATLAEKGLYPESRYSYGNDEITVTDVTGDNALLGADGKVYFIDPIINFKKPVREILGDAAQPEAPAQGQREEIGATPAAEATALERVPRDEKGKPRFERAESPEAAWDALVEHHKGDAAKARVTAGIMVENTRKALEKARKLKPKGNDPDEILASQEAIEAQLAEAEHAHEFWQKMAGVEDARAAARQEAEKAAEEQRLAREREEAEKAAEEERRWKEQKSKLDKRLRATAEKYRDIPEVMELLEHKDPMSADEVAAWLLSRHKVLWKSTEGASGMVIKAGVGYHVGIGEGERRKLFGLFASEAKGGVSIERLAEDLFKEACEEFGVPYDNQEALNALIDMIREAYTMGDIRNYIANKRIADAEKMGEYVRAREDEEADAYYREAYGMSREEYEAREELMMEQARDFAKNFDEQEFFSNIADEIINRQRQEDEYRRNQAADAAGEGAAGGRGGEVLSPPQSAEAGRDKGAAGEAARGGGRDRAAQHHQDGDLAGGTPRDAGLNGAERRSGALTEAEVVKYEARVKSQLEDYVNNGIRESDAIQMLRKDIYRHETVYLSAGYSPEEAQAKATKLVDDIISKLTPKKVGGFTIYIENERGNVRRGVDEDDNVWETEMRNDYGFISDAKSTDGDNIDVFLSADIDGWDGRKVYVVDQYNSDGTFDEHKVMLGFNSKEEAFAAYLSNYEKGWEKGRRLDCTEVNIEDFEKWVESSHRKTKAFAEYKGVKAVTEGKDAREGISPDDKPADAEGTDDGPLAEARGLDKKAGADAERHPGDGVGGAVPQAYRTMHEADRALTDHMRGMELGDLEKNEENLAAMTRLHEEYHQRIDEYADALTGMSDAQAEKAADDAPLVEDILRRAMQFGYRDETRRKFEDVKRRIDGILANRLLGEAYTKSPEMAEAGRKAGKFKVSEVSDKTGDASGAYSGVNHHGEDKVAVASNGRVMVVSAIVKGVEDVLADGEFTLDSSLGRVEKRGARYLKDGAGRVYGWTDGKRIYLNKDAMNPETPVHEYTHLWDEMVMRENPELWAWGKELMKQTPVWDEVMDDPNYADIRDDEDAVASEVHSRLTGERGAEILERMIDDAEKKGAMATAEAVTLVERIKAWLGEMFRALRKTLGRWSGRELEELTAEDFVNLTLRDLAEGMNPKAEAEGPLAEARGLDKKNEADASAEAEAARRAEVANEAIDRYAERHESIRQSYGELIERAREAGNEALAEGLEERMYSEQQAATEELELGLTDYYQSEGNSGTDASRMASDMSARVRADIRLRRRGYFPQQARGKGQETRGEGQESTVVTAGGERIEFRTEKAREGSGLPGLKEGEFTLVERTFTETGEFGFTGKDRIETADDVAYIFRSLENYSVENTFAVLVKDGRPLIVHTGMGTATMSPMDMAALRAAYDEYGADEVYMVHNHPSGSLKASMEDARLLKTVTGMFAPGTVKDGIIIDVTSGRYCTFDTTGKSAEATSSRPAGEVPHPARRFDGRNRELKAEFDKTEPTIIRGSGDVAGYVAGKRLGGGSKISMLLLSQRGQVTGNIITDHEVYAGNEETIAGEMARLGTRYGARRVIPYGNAELSSESVRKLAAEVKRQTGGSVEVIDALQITNGLGGYVSAQDSYMMEGAAAYGKRETRYEGLSDNQRNELIASMKSLAERAPVVELTDDSWQSEVTTPLGVVKMGENQRKKLSVKGREDQYGMLLETLGNPDIVLEERDITENPSHERGSSYLFIKTFLKEDGSKYVHFESVTVSKEGMEVSISSHIIRENQLKKKLKSDRLLYKATALDESANPSAEQPAKGAGSLSSENVQALTDKQRMTLADVDHPDLDSTAKIVEKFENPEIPEEKRMERQGDSAEKTPGPDTMDGAVTLIGDKLNAPIRVISRKEAEAEGYGRKKGWYDRTTRPQPGRQETKEKAEMRGPTCALT